MNKISILLVAFLISCASGAKIEEKKPAAPEATQKPATDEKPIASAETVEKNYDETGLSSWYGEQFQNKPTASGELFDRFKLTAAHRTLPFGTEVKVHNLENQKETLVRINDRGPFNKTRIIDVSERAAEILEFKEIGVAKVGLTVINPKEEGPVVAKKDTQLVRDEDNFSLEDDDEEEDDEEEDTLIPPKKEEPKKKGGTTSVEPPASKNPPTKNPPAKTTPAAKETVKESPKETTKESTKASKDGNDPQPKGYSVQIGVFKEKKRAESFKAQVKAAFNETVFLFLRSGTYVVQIGDFSNRNDAVILRDKVKEKGIFGFIPQK